MFYVLSKVLICFILLCILAPNFLYNLEAFRLLCFHLVSCVKQPQDLWSNSLASLSCTPPILQSAALSPAGTTLGRIPHELSSLPGVSCFPWKFYCAFSTQSISESHLALWDLEQSSWFVHLPWLQESESFLLFAISACEPITFLNAALSYTIFPNSRSDSQHTADDFLPDLFSVPESQQAHSLTDFQMCFTSV